jgi:hypothetical protein
MISRTQLQIAVGVAAGIYVLGFFLLNQPAETVVLRLYGLVVAVVSFLFVIFDRCLWKVLRKVPGVNAVFKHPVLHGTWKGTFQSSYVYPETGKTEGPTEAYLVVRQTYSSTDFPPPLLQVLRISFSAHVPRTIYLQNPVIRYLKYSISLGWVRRKRTEIVHQCSYSLRRNAFQSPP